MSSSFSAQAQESTINSDTTTTAIKKDTAVFVEKSTKSDLKTSIIYSARDSIWFSIEKQTVILNGDAKVNYGEIDLEADIITINYNTGQINATYSTDSLGRKIGIPHFMDGDDEYFAEKIGHNYKTSRGTVSRILTRQNEGWIRGEKTLKTKDDILYIKNGEFCPCEDSTATTFIRSNKIKIIPEKRIVTGPAVLYIGDVPTPLIMPFGIFPASGTRSSGVIIPRRFGEIEGRGFYLAEGGYYWAVNDYLGIEFLGEVYGNGGWGAGGTATYKSRYKYDGRVFLNYRKVVQNGDENEAREVGQEFKFNWLHSPKSRGGKKFSADVNFASTSYNRFNELSTDAALTNSLNSNVSYFTPLGRNSPFSLSMKLRHSQNNIEETVDMTLPDISLNMSRRLPFRDFKKGKRSILNELIRSTGIAYTMKFQNRLSNQASNLSVPFELANPDDVNREFKTFDLNTMFENAEYGIQHTIPISASIKLGKSFSLNPSFNYTENWYPKKLDYEYAGGDSVTINRSEGTSFNRASWYSTALTLNTSYYMTYSFKGKSETKLRHVLRPSISGRFSPDFTQGPAYTNVQSDNDEFSDVSLYQGMIYSYGGGREQATLGISLQNNFEVKKNKKFSDTTDLESIAAKDRFKYIKLIENFTVSGNYNFAADSLNLSKLSFVASTKLFNLFTIQGRTTVDPYIYRSSDSIRINSFAWDNSQGIGNLESGSLTVGSTFNNDVFKKKSGDRIQDRKDEQVFDYVPYVDFSLPWSLSLNYNINYRQVGFNAETVAQSLSFSGSLGLTQKWQVTYRAAYDFETKNIITPNLILARDLGCWVMNFNWVPFGPRQSYNFELHVKASVLKDLNLRRSRSYYDQER